MAEHFLVPQFIDVEPKIIGPITVRQFLIMLVGFLFIFIEFKLFDFLVFAFSGTITFAIFGTFAFAKINGRPFHYFMLNVVETFKRPRLYMWDKTLSETEIRQLLAGEHPAGATAEAITKQLPAKGRLEELALVVNTGGSYRPTTDLQL